MLSKHKIIAAGILVGFFSYISTRNSSMTLAMTALTMIGAWVFSAFKNRMVPCGRFFNSFSMAAERIKPKNKNFLVQQCLFRIDGPYQIEVLNNKHVDEVICLFTKSFCQYEPMTRYLDMTESQFRPFAERVIRKAASDGLSIIAHDGKNVVACAIVEDIANPVSLELSEMDSKFRFIFGLLENLSGQFFKDKDFRKNHLSHLFITAVDIKHQGRGLSGKVNMAAMELSRKNGFDFMCCEFTNGLNEKGTIKRIEHKKVLIGTCCYRDFYMDGTNPFQNLDGGANAYLWELKPGVKLVYYKTSIGPNHLISHSFDEEFQNRSAKKLAFC